MPSLTDYFAKVAYKPTYLLGDRVRGMWNGVPFAGITMVDTLLDEEVGPYIMVQLDLPIKLDNSWHNMIKVSHKDLIDIKGKYELNSKTNSKRSTMDSNRRSKQSRKSGKS